MKSTYLLKSTKIYSLQGSGQAPGIPQRHMLMLYTVQEALELVAIEEEGASKKSKLIRWVLKE